MSNDSVYVEVSGNFGVSVRYQGPAEHADEFLTTAATAAGITSSCPAWCDDHQRNDEYGWDYHRGHTLHRGDLDEHTAVEVTASGGRAHVHPTLNVDDMTPAEARQYGWALIRAAEMLGG